MTEVVTDRQIFEKVIEGLVPTAKSILWIATADIKDMHIPTGTRTSIPFLGLLAELAKRGVAIRLIHAKEPGPRFQESFDAYPNLLEHLEMMHCPRCHLKTIIVDMQKMYIGSANLTGAGLGAKSSKKRNFEAGIISSEPALLEPIIEQFDTLWLGAHCGECGRKEFCAQFAEMK